ncbi:MAG: hypothetical protein KGL68_03070 [Burkholderiales bacterium]|nr:hypothetical protein [Burkholderiales bacterium]
MLLLTALSLTAHAAPPSPSAISLGMPSHWDYLHLAPDQQRVYLAHEDHIDVVDTRTLQAIDQNDGVGGAHGVGNDAAGYDARHQLAFSSDKDGTLDLIRTDGLPRTPAHLVTLPGARTMAEDPHTATVYEAAPDASNGAQLLRAPLPVTLPRS